MAVLLVFSIVSLAVFFQSKPLTRFARSLIQGSRPPTATFKHFTGEGVMVTVALASAMIISCCEVLYWTLIWAYAAQGTRGKGQGARDKSHNMHNQEKPFVGLVKT